MQGTIQHLSFTKRNIPIPADYRHFYKIGHIILILFNACRGNKASLMKMHFLSWAIKSKKNMAIVDAWVKNDFKNDFHIWGIEPTVNRALRFAAADDLIIDGSGDFSLTDKGSALAKLVMRDEELFSNEKKFLKVIGKSTITEQRVKDLTSKFF